MFKFEIIKTIPIKQGMNLPRFILANSQKQAEEIYKNFAGVLNRMSYRYSQITGIEKSDLFGEAILGLAIAYQNWGQIHNALPKKIFKGFKTYAIYSIKDALNEYIRLNSSSVKIPSYLMKAINNFRRLKNILENINIEYNIIEQIIDQGNIEDIKLLLTKNDVDRAVKLLKNLTSAAERASITLKELYNRCDLISFHNIEINNIDNIKSDENNINTTIIINELKSRMNKDELTISNYIMEGHSIPEIGRLMNKEQHWIRYKLKKFKRRII